MRLAAPEFALNDDAIEVLREAEALDLRPLTGGASVGRHAEADPVPPKPLNRLNGAREEAYALITKVAVTVRDLGAGAGPVVSQGKKCLIRNPCAGSAKVEATLAGTHRVGPEPVPLSLDGVEQRA